MSRLSRPSALAGLLFLLTSTLLILYTITPTFLYPLGKARTPAFLSPHSWPAAPAYHYASAALKGCGLAASAALALRALIRRRATAAPAGPGAMQRREDEARRVMAKFAEKYARRTGTKFCRDRRVTARVIKGLAQHKVELGAPLCPCRDYDDKKAEVKRAYWNCPCVPMRTKGHCHCMLFLQPDSPWASDSSPRMSIDDIEDLAPDEP
ncbi:hypothetical protein FOZ62_008421 [Perkinsus olseni]|uniref:ferredoxin:thioredoxin reductase n=1 Tax=Perkinsus olseni TaxID=32597 RepID=A0A7J6RMG1_PEROL|nr:hypothetical protein FOZ62_008421 [Perkinsus olseni]